LSILSASLASADDGSGEALRADRQRIQGRWQVVELTVDGRTTPAEDVRKLMVVNGVDGSWRLLSDGSEISRGESTFDPAAGPKTIDFTPTAGAGSGERYEGIYELDDTTRRLCFSTAGQQRPMKFASEPGSQQILVRFERIAEQ